MKSVAIIPTMNEEKHIRGVIEKTIRHVDNVIVVDSSDDRTPEICKHFGEKIMLLRCEKMGKGYSVRIGIERAFELKPDYLIFLDGDNEKNPDDVPAILEKLKEFDIVIGKRDRMRSKRRIFFNRISNFWSRLVTGYDVTDVNSGFFALRCVAAKKLELETNGFEIETEIILEASRNNLSFTEIPVSVPQLSPSTLNIRHMLEMNRFFDLWVMKNIHFRDYSLKKVILFLFCFMGFVISSSFLFYNNLKFIRPREI